MLQYCEILYNIGENNVQNYSCTFTIRIHNDVLEFTFKISYIFIIENRNRTEFVTFFFYLDKVFHNDTTVLPEDPGSVNRCCTRKVLYKRLPILQWLPKYTLKDHGVSDLVAGFTVGLTVIPQAIAFANVAGLPPQVSCIHMCDSQKSPCK